MIYAKKFIFLFSLVLYSAAFAHEFSFTKDFESFDRFHSTLIHFSQKIEKDLPLRSKEGDAIPATMPRTSGLHFIEIIVDSVFSPVMASTQRELCFFAGWPSYMNGGYCDTPWSHDGDRYLRPIGDTYGRDYFCGKRDVFRCHPVLFGPGESGRGHCVPTSGYDEVSGICFEKLLEEPDQIYKAFQLDPEYRETYLNYVQHIIEYCQQGHDVEACEYFMASILDLDQRVCSLDDIRALMGQEAIDQLQSNWSDIKTVLAGREEQAAKRQARIEKYSNSAEVQIMINTIRTNAARVCTGQSTQTCRASKNPRQNRGLCWRYVKLGLVDSGLTDSYVVSRFAVEAERKLPARGFTNILEDNPSMRSVDAPIGAILVYEKFPGSRTPGHIEVKLGDDEYGSDFISNRPIDQYNPARRLVGIYIK